MLKGRLHDLHFAQIDEIRSLYHQLPSEQNAEELLDNLNVKKLLNSLSQYEQYKSNENIINHFMFAINPNISTVLINLVSYGKIISKNNVILHIVTDSDFLIDMLENLSWINLIKSNNFYRDNIIKKNLVNSFTSFSSYKEWLTYDVFDELVTTIETFPNAAISSAKVISTDYTFVDSMTPSINDLDGKDPNLSQTCYVKQIKTTSHLFLVKNKILNLHLENKGNSILDDNDLYGIFNFIDQKNYQNYYTPLAVSIIHEKFIEKFSINCDFTSSHTYIEKKNKKLPHILFLDFRIPEKTEDAGSVVDINLMQSMISLGWQVTFVPTIIKDYCPIKVKALIRIGVEVIYQGSGGDDLSNIIKNRLNSLTTVFAVRYVVLHPIQQLLKDLSKNLSIVYLNADLHYIREYRESTLNFDHQGIVNSLITKQKELECSIFADCNVVHTQFEKEEIKKEINVDSIILPYAIEIYDSQINFSGRNDLMFLGGYEHTPNVDAVIYFVNEIWSKLKKDLPHDTKLHIVGAKPTKEILALKSDRINVTGKVKDLQEYFDRTRVFIAPLRYGAGIKGKVITAMAHGVPCVMTSIASEGIDAYTAVNFNQADTAVDFANSVVQVYNDENLWNELKKEGYKYVNEKASFEAYRKICQEIITKAESNYLEKLNNEINKNISNFKKNY